MDRYAVLVAAITGATVAVVTLSVGYGLSLYLSDTTPDVGCADDCPWCPEADEGVAA